MENLTAKRQFTNCARKTTELRTTCLKPSTTMAVIVLGLLSVVSNGQVVRSDPSNYFGLDLNRAFGNSLPMNDGLSSFEKPWILPDLAGAQIKWAQPNPKLIPKISRQPTARVAASVSSANQFVLRDFASPPNGAYPATAVIRDSAGNLALAVVVRYC